MALEQIILIDEDGSKCTIRSSDARYQTWVLKRVVKDEWRRVREIGARLVTKARQAR